MYPFLRSNKTERTIQRMIQEDHMPYVQFHEEFINMDLETLSRYKTEYIEEWFRTSQILLFESFQQNMNGWLEACRQKKQEAKDLKERNKVVRFQQKRETEYNRSQTIDTDRIYKLPDDLIRHIWSYTDTETRTKFYIGKYPPEQCHEMLNHLTCPIIRKIFKQTTFCYKGYVMKRELYPWHKKAQPCSGMTKQELINNILPFLNNMEECYHDEKVMVTKTDKGMKIRCFVHEFSSEERTLQDPDIEVLYPFYGTIYPVQTYEKNANNLWKTLLVAHHLFG
jgi:hypothetical protein